MQHGGFRTAFEHFHYVLEAADVLHPVAASLTDAVRQYLFGEDVEIEGYLHVEAAYVHCRHV